MQLDYTVIEIDENKLKDPIPPINLNKPAAIKDTDGVLVVQHPLGKGLAFSYSDVEVAGESPICIPNFQQE